MTQVPAKANNSVVVIGIGGPSGAGKTTLACSLAKNFDSKFLPISQDMFVFKHGTDWGQMQKLLDLMVAHAKADTTPPDKFHYGKYTVPVCRKATGQPLIIFEGYTLFHDPHFIRNFSKCLRKC